MTTHEFAALGDQPGEEPCDEILAERPVYLGRRRADLQRMRDALTAGNFAVIQSLGHNCKGTGAGYGFPDISRIGMAIEKAAKAADARGVVNSLLDFEDCIRNAA